MPRAVSILRPIAVEPLQTASMGPLEAIARNAANNSSEAVEVDPNSEFRKTKAKFLAVLLVRFSLVKFAKCRSP